MGFRLAPREVAPLSSSAGWSPVFVHFGSGSPSLGEVLKMKMNEFAFAISTLHFPTLGKWIKAISEVAADGATPTEKEHLAQVLPETRLVKL